MRLNTMSEYPVVMDHKHQYGISGLESQEAFDDVVSLIGNCNTECSINGVFDPNKNTAIIGLDEPLDVRASDQLALSHLVQDLTNVPASGIAAWLGFSKNEKNYFK